MAACFTSLEGQFWNEELAALLAAPSLSPYSRSAWDGCVVDEPETEPKFGGSIFACAKWNDGTCRLKTWGPRDQATMTQGLVEPSKACDACRGFPTLNSATDRIFARNVQLACDVLHFALIPYC